MNKKMHRLLKIFDKKSYLDMSFEELESIYMLVKKRNKTFLNHAFKDLNYNESNIERLEKVLLFHLRRVNTYEFNK